VSYLTLVTDLERSVHGCGSHFGDARSRSPIRNDPAPVNKANDRLLPAPRVERFETPYAIK
jgi:hypothetical protein